ncbi:MAG: HAMP domain-containing histidine kinase [Deltaproteobacteria bacterium]|nr:HAMP domain-containing histidine kinase [Deltaproteobacteria bacterium]
MKSNRYEKLLTGLIASRTRFFLLTVALFLVYAVGFIVFDHLVVNEQRYVLFAFGLVVSSLVFSWLLGGKAAFVYVTFFNLFFTFVYAKPLFDKGTLYGSLFLSRSFIIIFVSFVVLMLLMVLMESPADKVRKRLARETKEEKEKTRLLEFLVTERKITQDVVAQSNFAKDELLVLQGAWRSQIHNIINDLPESKENDLYRRIIEPFQEAILRHLKGLERKLTFEPLPMDVRKLSRTVEEEITADLASLRNRYDLDVRLSSLNGFQGRRVQCDPHKLVEILRNLIKNAQKAIELKQIEMMKEDFDAYRAFRPFLSIVLGGEDGVLTLEVTDNGGGVSEEHLDKVFKEPIPSSKKDGYGLGTTFVKFFAERMGFNIRGSNVMTEHGKGFRVTLEMPVEDETGHREPESIQGA